MGRQSGVGSGLRFAGLAVTLLLVFAGRSEAKFKSEVGGVTITYSNDGAAAYFDPNDGTLTVEVSGSGGSLRIVVGSSAYFSWGGEVDIYILADSASLKSITIIGSPFCTPFVCGQVGYVDKFSMKNGVVGDTAYYGQDFGLGMVSLGNPMKVTLTNGYATAQMFGFEYTGDAVAPQSTVGEQPMAPVIAGKHHQRGHASADKQASIGRLQAAAR